MLCQICEKRIAEIKIGQAINDKKIEMNLCKTCAEEKGFNNPLFNLPQLFENFIAELVGQEVLDRKPENADKACPNCGTTWESFHDTGLLGCDICYHTYGGDLKVILRRIHGSNQHIGSRPKPFRHVVDETKLAELRSQLEEAVSKERFERAAELRDIIRDAQREIDKKNDDGILR